MQIGQYGREAILSFLVKKEEEPMNTEIINQMIKQLIVKKDYLLVPAEDGRRVVRSGINLLIKQEGQFMSYVQIIDADQLPLETIKARLQQKDGLLRNLEDKAMTRAYAILVIREEKQPEKSAWIRAWQDAHAIETDSFKCLLIDPEQETVIKLFNRSYKDSGLYKVLKPLFKHKEIATTNEIVEELANRKEEDYTFAIPSRQPVITYTLLAINITVYLALYLYSQFSGTSYDQLLIQFGAKVNSEIISGAYWRFLTPIFLHGSLLHLLVNSYSLWMVGSLVERLFGSYKFMMSYLIAGIVGNIASFLFVQGYSVGASGAIFGLMGMLLYFGLCHPLQFRIYFGRSILSTLLINLVYGLATPGIDNFAHLGGLLGGFLAIGACSANQHKKWYCNQILYILLLLAVVIGGITYGFTPIR